MIVNDSTNYELLSNYQQIEDSNNDDVSKKIKSIPKLGLFFQNLNIFQSIVRKKSVLKNDDIRRFLLKKFKPKKIINDVKNQIQNKDLDEFFKNTSVFQFLSQHLVWKNREVILRRFILNILLFSTPVLQDFLTSLYETQKDEQTIAILSIFMMISLILITFHNVWTTWKQYEQQLEVQIILQYLLYRKSLVVKNIMQNSESPNLLNLITIDVSSAINYINSFHATWSSIHILIMSLIFLIIRMKTAIVIGITLCVMILILNFKVALKIGQIFNKSMHQKDLRISLTQDILKGIKQVKFLNWGDIFLEKIFEIRKSEYQYLQQTKYLDAICVYCWAMCTLMISTITFVSYQIINHDIKDQNIFTIISLLNMLIGPLNCLPWSFAGIMSGKQSMIRIQQYLLLPEIQLHKPFQNVDQNVIEIKNLSFQHIGNNNSSTHIILNQINLNVKKGQIIMIIGKEGSGKTSFLKQILNEMQHIEGTMKIYGKIAYCAQNPWLQNQSVRDNILFGQEMDFNFYNECVYMCDLQNDFEAFGSFKDQKLISQDGSNISGGQKQRIALCRVLYQNSDIILLDDSLSAIDADIGLKIIDRAFQNYIRKYQKTVIFVVSQRQYIQFADQVYEIKDQQLIEYKNIKQDLILDTQEMVKNETQNFDEEIHEEIREHGNVKMDTFLVYYKNMGWLLFFSSIITIILMQIFKVLYDLWLKSYVNDDPFYIIDDFNKTIIIITIISMVVTLIRSFIFAYANLIASKKIFFDLMIKIMNAEMKFFDLNSIGRIISRLSGDTQAVDTDISFQTNILFNNIFIFLGAISVISIQFPWILNLFLIVFILFYYLQKHYRQTSRELKRLDSINTSTLLTHVQETQDGITTIRSLNNQSRFQQEFEKKIKNCTNSSFLLNGIQSWLDMRLEIIGCSVSLFVLSYSYIQLKNKEQFDSNNFSISIAYSIGVTSLLKQMIVSITTTEKDFISLERINQYLQLKQKQLMPEIDSEISENLIVFKNVSLTYENNVKALNNISFQIKKGQKIAFVGRSGSGKSSILNALFGLYEIDPQSQIICKNKINLSQKQMKQLIQIIPQNGFVFSGSVRQNLDPYNIYNEQMLQETLNKYRNNFATKKVFQLNFQIEESGKNLSNGEKQILNFLRVVICKSEVVCLDEASSSLDPETDQALNNILIKDLDTTLILITHRLHNLKNFDNIFVVDQGKIVENGSFTNLMQKQNQFYNLYNKN